MAESAEMAEKAAVEKALAEIARPSSEKQAAVEAAG
jgi:hypothetical protein